MRRTASRRFAGLAALALLAGACGDDDDPSATTTTTAPSADDEGAAAGTDPPVESVPGVEAVYEDPRSELFAEFQQGFDRSHPFQSLESYCREHEAVASPEATDDGITAEAVTVVHVRARIEQLAGLGFAIPVGDPADAYEAFVAAVNDCGGVRGRQLDLRLVEVDAYSPGQDIDALRNAACIEATEDNPGVIVMNMTGFQGSANLCLVEDAGVAFITTQGQPGEYMERGEDRLLTVALSLEESLRFLAEDLIASGVLEGATIGVIAPDTPGLPEAVEEGLVDRLEAAGLEVAVFDVIGCAGSATCVDGTGESVANLRAAGVDALFPTLNVVSLPQYLTEMIAQGFEPGDVQFYNSDVNSQANELPASKVVAFGGTAAGDLYNGAIMVDAGNPGGYRLNDFATTPFEELCHATYARYSPKGLSHQPRDMAGSAAYGVTVGACAQVRMAARAIYDAGANPTRADIYRALADLGPVDLQGMLIGSIRPGKTSMLDAIHTLRFEYPCTRPFPFGDEGICIAAIDEYRPAPR
jgi:hypothetical protein